MGVYIKDLEMPKNCWSCRMFCNCFAYEGYDCHCAALGKKIGTEAEVPRNKRRDDCPLVPVPPHGRLIDADALCNRLEKAGKIKPYLEGALNVAISFALTAPTIVPAEEGE